MGIFWLSSERYYDMISMDECDVWWKKFTPHQMLVNLMWLHLMDVRYTICSFFNPSPCQKCAVQVGRHPHGEATLHHAVQLEREKRCRDGQSLRHTEEIRITCAHQIQNFFIRYQEIMRSLQCSRLRPTTRCRFRSRSLPGQRWMRLKGGAGSVAEQERPQEIGLALPWFSDRLSSLPLALDSLAQTSSRRCSMVPLEASSDFITTVILESHGRY